MSIFNIHPATQTLYDDLILELGKPYIGREGLYKIVLNSMCEMETDDVKICIEFIGNYDTRGVVCFYQFQLVSLSFKLQKEMLLRLLEKGFGCYIKERTKQGYISKPILNPIINHLELIQRIGNEFIEIKSCEEVHVRDSDQIDIMDRETIVTLYVYGPNSITVGSITQFKINHRDILNKPLAEVITFIRQCYEEAIYGRRI